MTYTGHRSWNSWNISLWINNDEYLYKYCRDTVEVFGLKQAVKILTKEFQSKKTPDGGKYNYTCIFEAIKDIL